jgi:hypothetical protein
VSGKMMKYPLMLGIIEISYLAKEILVDYIAEFAVTNKKRTKKLWQDIFALKASIHISWGQRTKKEIIKNKMDYCEQ